MFPRRFKSPRHAWLAHLLILTVCLGLAACGGESNPYANNAPIATTSTITSPPLSPTFNEEKTKAEIEQQYRAYLKASTDITTLSPDQQNTYMDNLITSRIKLYLLKHLNTMRGNHEIYIGYPIPRISTISVSGNQGSLLDCSDSTGVYVKNTVTGAKKPIATEKAAGLKVIFSKAPDGYWVVSDTEYAHTEACK